MPDVFATITQASPEILEVIGNTLELRATLPQYQAILRSGNDSPESGPDPLNYLYLLDETIASQPTL